MEKHRIGRCIQSNGVDAILDVTQFCPNPGRHESHGHHGCRSGVDDIGQLLARHLEFVGNGPHGVAYHEGIGVVVEKDTEVHKESHQLS